MIRKSDLPVFGKDRAQNDLSALTMRAGAGDLYYRQFRYKPGGTRRGVESFRARGGQNLAHRAAAFADQERHHGGGVMVVRAGEIGVATLDAMDEAIVHQELQRAID